MGLIDESMENCILLDHVSVPDAVGTFTRQWVDGAKFTAAITKNSTMEAKIAEKQGVTEVYIVTVYKGVKLEYHDVFRRELDGLTYRVTSNIKDKETPYRASFQIGQVSAERWDLPDD